MEEVKLDWKVIEDNNELKILKEYGYECYLFGLIVNSKKKIRNKIIFNSYFIYVSIIILQEYI